MKNAQRFAWTAFIGLLALSAFQIIYYYPKLPGMMATHFNAAGYSDGYMDKSSFTFVYLALLVIMAVSFGVLSYIFPRMLDISNMPNKDFWLQKKNRPYAIHVFTINYLAIGTVTLLFFLNIFQKVVKFNILGLDKMSNIWPELIIFLAVTALIITNLIRSYGKKAMKRISSG